MTAGTPADGSPPTPLLKSPWLWGAVVGIFILTSLQLCSGRRLATLPNLGDAPEFELLDQSGERFSSDDLRGEVWIAGFIFTTCVTVCPQVTGAMVDVQRRLEREGASARLITFTVDPEYDTPARLLAYARKYRANLERWTFLTGPREILEGVVIRGFQLALGDRETDEHGVVDIAHSTKLVLIDRFGRVRHYFNSDEDELGLLVAHAIRLETEGELP